MSNDAEAFLTTLARGLTTDERLILCGFAGDPAKVEKTAWRPRPWRPGREVPFNERQNAYVTVSSFCRSHDGTWRRRTDAFRAGLALMVDDVGTSPSSHVHPSKVRGITPTMAVETSPKNFQLWFCLQEPERNRARFDAIIRAFIKGQLLGKDSGMSGVNRVGRLPGFVNGKAKHNGFVTKLVQHEPDRRYTIEELCSTFDLTLTDPPPLRVVTNEIAEYRVKMFWTAYKFLERRKMLKRNRTDPSGWRDMHCPWTAGHSDAADNGASIREPRAENQHYGAFRCHHGSCSGRGWQQLTDWIADRAEEELSNHG